MPWIVILHIILIAGWVGGLMLVMALCADRAAGEPGEDEPLRSASLHLFAWVACLAGVGGVLTGGWLAYARGFDGGWLPTKLLFVCALCWLHLYIGRLTARLRDGDRRPRVLYWLVSAGPPLVSLPILLLVLAKPF